MVTLRSVLKSLGPELLRSESDTDAPSRLAMMSGGVITVSLVLLLLVV